MLVQMREDGKCLSLLHTSTHWLPVPLLYHIKYNLPVLIFWPAHSLPPPSIIICHFTLEKLRLTHQSNMLPLPKHEIWEEALYGVSHFAKRLHTSLCRAFPPSNPSLKPGKGQATHTAWVLAVAVTILFIVSTHTVLPLGMHLSSLFHHI